MLYFQRLCWKFLKLLFTWVKHLGNFCEHTCSLTLFNSRKNFVSSLISRLPVIGLQHRKKLDIISRIWENCTWFLANILATRTTFFETILNTSQFCGVLLQKTSNTNMTQWSCRFPAFFGLKSNYRSNGHPFAKQKFSFV